ncbi:Rhodanese-like domain-containing protein [Blyttiomyces helicus]|uniref:Rhodanese-like domain-containing protein n=1 Tax=Blyttiomyces helicus TaxID=388810 RepID=A0A4P9WFB0_9FUNG|nr:Rhodanese-like domain-containing protein [Blyttiomyces helicus]|eukprot:RKO90525.1 Rhodanese-like domain-containing protein [Blyttiomyces helicus]
MAPPKYMEPTELAGMLKNSALKIGKDFVIVDVRDLDFEGGGNIPGCLNAPSHLFLAQPEVFVQKFAGVKQVIFHCALSQVRGPKCAQRFHSTLTATGGSTDQQVYILRGGFGAWQALYKNEPSLVEQYNAGMWTDEY